MSNSLEKDLCSTKERGFPSCLTLYKLGVYTQDKILIWVLEIL